MSINAAMTFKTKLKLKKCAYFLHEHEVSKQFMHARERERESAVERAITNNTMTAATTNTIMK